MSIVENLHLGKAERPAPEAFYVRLGKDRFASTIHSQGAWQPGEQHLAPASSLLVAEVERRLPSDKLISRVSVDVLGVIYSGEFTIDIEVVRPGRTIELVEATMRHGARVSIRARIWRLVGSDTLRVHGLEWDSLPPPEDMQKLDMASVWNGGYVASLDARQEIGARPGKGRSWLRTAYQLVAGETDSLTAAFLKVVDTANGLVVRGNPNHVFFANVDLSVHLIRRPEPGWVGFETRVSFGATGLGETFSILSDSGGPIGTAAQALTVRLV